MKNKKIYFYFLRGGNKIYKQNNKPGNSEIKCQPRKMFMDFTNNFSYLNVRIVTFLTNLSGYTLYRGDITTAKRWRSV